MPDSLMMKILRAHLERDTLQAGDEIAMPVHQTLLQDATGTMAREQAALAPKQLGVQTVFARSFARIHRRNLIAQGIPPLTFASDEANARACLGDTCALPDLRAAPAEGRMEGRVRIAERNQEFVVQANFSPREHRMLNKCGMLAHVRLGGSPLRAPKGRQRVGGSGVARD
jgi:aconitate hydratase